MKNYCKIIFSLNKYRGIRCNSINDEEYVFETERKGEIDRFCNGKYELFIHHNGQLSDYSINGWSFSSIGKGSFHIPGNYESVHLDIEACAPNGQTCNFDNSIKNTSDFETEAASLYMSIVMVVSLCRSIDDAIVLFNAFKNGLNSHNLKDSLNQLKIIKQIIEKAKGNNEIPEKWIKSADSKYILMYKKFVDDVSKEDLLKLVFDL